MILRKSRPRQARNVSNPNVPLGFSLFNTGPRNTANVDVTQTTASSLSAMHRARQVKAEAIAGSPVRAFNSEGMQQEFALFLEPHPMFTWFEFCELMVTHDMFHGNFYALKNGGRTGAGTPVESLFPLNPNKVEPKWVEDRNGNIIERVYEVRMRDGKPVVLTDDEIFHIPGSGFDGLKGISVIQAGAQSLGTSIATEHYAGKFYGEGTMSSGILTTDKRLQEEEAKGLKARWKQTMAGLDNAHEVMVMDNGAHFEALSIKPVEAQFLEVREFNVQEISRWTGVPSKLLMQTSQSGTDRAIEQDGLEFSTYGMRGTKRRIESRFTQFIMPGDLRMDISLSDFERGDTKTRSGAHLLARKASYKSINEIRREENLPAYDDERADDIFFELAAEGAGPESGGENVGGETVDQGEGAAGNGEVS